MSVGVPVTDSYNLRGHRGDRLIKLGVPEYAAHMFIFY